MSIVCGHKEVQGNHIQSTIVCFISVKISYCRSWKNNARVMENHGKIMEFDSGKALGTLCISCTSLAHLCNPYYMDSSYAFCLLAQTRPEIKMKKIHIMVLSCATQTGENILVLGCFNYVYLWGARTSCSFLSSQKIKINLSETHAQF